jgi:uncharacterized RDD family membrane protein YckC
MKYAGVGIRGLAQLLDFLLFCLVFFPVTYFVKGTWLMTPEDHLWIIFDPICGVFLVIIFAYYILLEGWLGTTVGKRILRLQVISAEGSPVTMRQSLVRNLARLIDGLPFLNLIGIVSIAKSPTKQRIGDKIAKTCVVKIH